MNTLAGSYFIPYRRRQQIYLLAGIDCRAADVGPRCRFETPRLSFGADALVSHGVHFQNAAEIVVGERVGLGFGVRILTDGVGPTPRPVRLQAGTWVGARATILGGVTVGEGCVIGAGAVVSDDCAPHGLYLGAPARRIRDLPS